MKEFPELGRKVWALLKDGDHIIAVPAVVTRRFRKEEKVALVYSTPFREVTFQRSIRAIWRTQNEALEEKWNLERGARLPHPTKGEQLSFFLKGREVRRKWFG